MLGDLIAQATLLTIIAVVVGEGIAERARRRRDVVASVEEWDRVREALDQ